MSEQGRVLIIDAMNTYLRSYVVDPSLSASGNPIGGCMGFMKQLQRFCREVRPTEILVVWDGQGGSKKRRRLNKEYKEGRKPISFGKLNRSYDLLTEDQEKENKIWQQIRLFEYLNVLPVKQFLYDDVEADDIIAVCCQHKAYAGHKKIIVSNDKDFFQLCDNETILYRPSEKKYVTRVEVIERNGIHPNNFALARAVAGDSSDNLVGVPGVGLKTVAKLFPQLKEEEFVTLDRLWEFCKETEKKLKAHSSILENKEIISLNYKLMQLYVPSLGVELSRQVDEVIASQNRNFSLTELRKMIIIDGFANQKWYELETHMNRIKNL